VIATQPVGLSQHGATVQIVALERSAENEQGGYLWRGELRLWDAQILMGYDAAADGNVRSKGTMFFVLHAQGEHAHRRWVGLSDDGPVVSGYVTLARDQEQAKAVMTRLLDQLVAHVVERHPYEVPNVTALPIVGGNPDYLVWLADETHSGQRPTR
jgi:hypothetical protein